MAIWAGPTPLVSALLEPLTARLSGTNGTRVSGYEMGYNHFPSANGVSIYSISVTGFDTLYFDNANTIGLMGVLGGNYSNASGYAGSSVSGVAFSFGAGLRYNITNNIDARLMYVRNDLANNTYYSQNKMPRT